MKTDRLRNALGNLRLALAPRDADACLLARFLATHDEIAFAALLRRHGPMVLGVCRRVLRHEQDAEDALQATFLVLARKARSLRKREAVGNWLYGVAYRTAHHVRAVRARRQTREQQVEAFPHPQIGPAEPQDWRPLLDQELRRLPEKYRAPVVLCDLEGLTRREAALQLGLPDGTFSHRLAAGRRLLAQRLSRRGVLLSGGALATLLSGGAASAQLSAALLVALPRAAMLFASGHGTAALTPITAFTREVLRAMFLQKMKLAVLALVAVGVLGFGGVAYHSETLWAGQAGQPPQAKPRSELEELRRQNELLRLNLEVVLEKVRAQEKELSTLRKQVGDVRQTPHLEILKDASFDRLESDSGKMTRGLLEQALIRGHEKQDAEVTKQAEAALKALRDAKDDPNLRRRALEQLDRAVHALREQIPDARRDTKDLKSPQQ